MADETTQDPNQLKLTGDAAAYAQAAMDNFSAAADGARSVLDLLNSKTTQFRATLESSSSLTKEQTAQFGLLSTAIIGTRRAFDNLSGIDTSSLNTFSAQILDIQRTILQDSSLPTMASKAGALASILIRSGQPIEKINELVKQGASAVFSYASNLAESADNGLRLQNAFIQLSAATGNLNAIYETSGGNLDKINFLLAQQQKMITDASTATGVSAEVVSQYYAQLGSIPQALTSTVNMLEGTTEKTGLLTAAIRVATGSGRSFNDVTDDMRIAFRNYNITGEEALKFTTRASELSNKFGIELSDVRDALRTTSDQFKIFGNEAEGAANIYNSYLGALQSTGISGNVAIDVVRGMVNGIKELGIAQKGFLSSQTGGPGGLMGAFQIEKELREGKIDKVFDRVRQSLGKQFGSIVTLEEASQSQAAAAQLTKQIQILRQGALGSFAKDDQSAIRILEAFKAREQGKTTPTELSQTLVQDTAKMGVEIEQKSYTELTRIRSLLEATRGVSSISNLSLLQGMSTAGVGTPNVDGEHASKLRDNLQQNINQAAIQSGQTSINYANDVVNRFVKDRTGQYSREIIENFGKFFDQLSPSIKAPIEEISRLISSGNTEGATTAYENYLKRLDEEKEAAMTLAKGAREQQLEQISSDRNNFNMAYEAVTNTAGSSVGFAAANAANTKNIAPTPSNPTTVVPIQNTPTGGNLGDITVHVEGYCLHCGEKMKNNSQSYAVNVGQRVEK